MNEAVTVPTRGELFVHPNPAEVLLDSAKFEAFYQTIVKETNTLVPDITTQKGRDAIKAVAFKVTKTKTFLDEFGKKLNEDRRKEIGIVDAARRTMRDKLETLKETVRKPLTDWETAEEERTKTITETTEFFRAAGVISDLVTLPSLAERKWRVTNMPVDPAVFGEETVFAENARTVALANIEAAILVVEKREADRAELERLRSEAEARRQADAERERQEASRIAEERRREAEAAEAHRREAEAVRAAQEAAERNAAVAAQAERDRHEAELAAERHRAEELEAAERARLADEKRVAEESDARRANAAHRAEVMLAVQKAIQNYGGIQEARAKKIVMAMAAGEVPHVEITY